jgi:hypothetical protein
MSPHGIARPLWEERFKARLAEKAVLTSEELPAVFDAEIESWPDTDDDEWELIGPEEAADENLSYWDNDE